MSDPNEMRRREATAQAGGAWSGTGPVVMTEKTAKDYKEANEAIAMTSKMGGWGAMAAMATKVLTITESGSFELLTKFLEMFMAFVRMGGAENMAELAEILFSEENVQLMKELGMGIGKTSDHILVLVRALDDIRKLFYTLGEEIEKNKIALEVTTTIIAMLSDKYWIMNAAIESVTTQIEVFTDVVEKLWGALTGGGGDGGGDDDKEWWEFWR